MHLGLTLARRVRTRWATAAVGLASALFLPSMGLGQVVIYPSAPDTQLSAAYSLMINGHSVAVEKYGPISIARFAFAGPAEIEVTVCQPVNSFDLSPKSAFAGSSANGNTIAFKLANPQKLVLRRVNSLSEELFILADPLETDAPTPGMARVTSLASYSIDSMGLTNTTPLFQDAIDRINAAGGGTLFVPPGKYRIDEAIVVKSNVNLYLAAGAVLEATPVSSRDRGSRSVISFKDAVNSRLSGRGIINGNCSNNAPVSDGFHIIHSENVDGLTIEDILILDPGTGVRLIDSRDSTVRNIKLIGGDQNGPRGGVDIESSDHIMMDSVFVYHPFVSPAKQRNVENTSLSISTLAAPRPVAFANVQRTAATGVNVKDFGAKGDGITDDRAAIQAAINSIQSGVITIPYSPKPYLIKPASDKSRFLTLKPNITLVFDPGATLKVADRSAPYDTVLTSTDCTNCVIRGGTIDANVAGNPITSSSEIMAHGRVEIAIWGGSNITVDTMTIKNSSSVNSVDLNGTSIDSVSIKNCVFQNMGNDPNHIAHDASAIYLHGNRATITGNRFTAAGRGVPGGTTAIEIHGSYNAVTGNTITDYAYGMNITGVYDSDSVTNSVATNTISGALLGIDIWSHTYGSHTSGHGINGLVVEKNSIRINQMSYAGLTFGTTTGGIIVNPNGDLPLSNVKIANNVIIFDTEKSVLKGSSTSIGIGWWSTESQAAENWSIENNEIHNAPMAGIRIAALIRGVQILGNIIENAGSSLDTAIPWGYKLPILIAAEPSSANLTISNNSISDTFDPTRIVYAMGLYGAAQTSGLQLCNNSVNLTGNNRAGFAGNLYVGGGYVDPSAAITWNRCTLQ